LYEIRDTAPAEREILINADTLGVGRQRSLIEQPRNADR
jgi:hypothetical protein